MMKEMRVRLRMDDAAYAVKLDGAIRFLEHNDQVKLTVMLKGRDIAHPDQGVTLLLKFATDLEEYASTELPPVVIPREVYLVFTPKATGQ
jgi:translation initiation factor IF-3